MDEVTHLIAALTDKDRDVRCSAAIALGKMRAVQAVPALIELLQDKYDSVRGCAVTALGKVGNSQAIPALIEALKDRDRDVRGYAVEALGEFGDSQIVPALIETLRDKDDSVYRRALEVLGKIGDPQAAPALIDALKDEHDYVRNYASAALLKIGPPALPALIKTLKNKDQEVHYEVVITLEKIAIRHPTPLLRSALPILNRLRNGTTDSKKRSLYQNVIKQIETATAAMKDLPLPAAMPEPSGKNLPVIATASAVARRDSLPIPSNAPPPISEGDQGILVLSDLRRRLRRLFRGG